MERFTVIFWILLFLPNIVFSDTVVASRTIRANSILTSEDLSFKDIDVPGGVEDVSLLLGMESRGALYAGRPIRMSDVGPPALVARNQIVKVIFQSGNLSIATEGRSLGRAAEGDYVQVMNLESRNTVLGVVSTDGRVFVRGGE